MKTLSRVLLSLLVGAVAFGVAAVLTTAGFEPWIELSLVVGVPVGISAGLTATFLTYAGLRFRELPADSVDRRFAKGMLGAAIAAAVGFVVVTALGVAVFFLGDRSLGVGVLVAGLPVALVLAAVVGYVLAVVRLGGRGRTGSLPG